MTIMYNKLIFFLSLLVLLVVNVSCQTDDNPDPNPDLNNELSEADKLSNILVFPNAVVINSATLPPSSPTNEAPVASSYDENISYSAGSKVVLPMDVSGLSGIKGVYIQVKGATTYFDVPINNNASSGTFVIPLDLPTVLGPGTFTLILKFYDANKKVSSSYEVTITVTKFEDCGVTKVSGGQGLTSNLFKIPSTPGKIKISYETFTVKDKIDVFQNGAWIGGTGPQTERSTIRRAASCAVATEAKGYVGKKSEFLFEVDPTKGTSIEVVVSGCENGGTKWEYTFSCPGAVASAAVPTVITTTISAIESTTASSGGSVIANNGADVTARGVVWGTNPNPTIVLATKTANGTGNGAFISSLTGLTANTKYYLRAYATNSVGTAYGDEVSFTTKSNEISLELDGKWLSSVGNGVIIEGSSARFYALAGSYKEAEKQGLVKIGDLAFKDITKISTIKWNCKVLMIYSQNSVPKAAFWSEVCTLTMSNDGKTISITGIAKYNNLTQNVSSTFTRQ